MIYRIWTCACVALMSVAPAWGQTSTNTNASTLTIYGLIDEGVERVNGVATGGGNAGHGWRVGSGTAASRLGFRGSEDLGGGLKAVFTLESGISVDTGAFGQGGRVFGRQAFVGLNGGFGSLTFGRQYTMRFFSTLDIDLFGAGSQGLGTLDPGFPNARADNSISYRADIGGFSGGVNFSFGRDAVAGNSVAATGCPGEAVDVKQCREWSVMAKYDASAWGVASSYERQYGGTATTFGGLTSPDRTDSRFILGGYVKISDARVAAGWVRRINQGIATPKSNLYWVVGSVPVAQYYGIDAMLAELKYDESPNKAVVYALRGTYQLSKRTNLYLTGQYIRNSGTLALAATTNSPATAPLPGGSQSSIILGVKHLF